MRHIYEIDCGRGIYWEVYVDGVCIHALLNQNEYDFYLDFLRECGVDFVIHTQEEYDEYHIALPSV
jgi:hypothetical protein